MTSNICGQGAVASREANGLGPVLAGRGSDGDMAAGLSPETLRRLASLGLTSACLAHDMGNLLQVVVCALHLIERSLPQPETANVRILCRDARTAMDRISTLRGQILDLVRVDPAVHRRVDPVALVTSLRGLVELALGPDIRLDLTCAADAPAVVCDAQQLENAIFNLVLNARDAMPSGGRLSLSLVRDTGDWPDAGVVISQPPRAVLTVRDTGCGMSAEVASQVFTPFFTTKPANKGTGLGLPMVSEFARRSGGTVSIESKPGFGTTVTLSLPGA